jgi:hypothetical protein
MTRLKIIISVFSISIIVLFSALYFGQIARAQDNDEVPTQQVLSDINTQLHKQKIPATAVQIGRDDSTNVLFPMNVLDITLQSSSDNDKVAPNDCFYINIIGREVQLIQRQGLRADAYRLTIVNKKSNTLLQVILPLSGKENLPTNFVKASNLVPNDVALTLRNVPTGNMTIEHVDVLPDEEGLLKCNIDVQAVDIVAVNAGVKNLLDQVQGTIQNLNIERGAEIAVFQLRIHVPNGESVLNYIADLQFGRTTWWQADELNKDWFPHPADVQEKVQ